LVKLERAFFPLACIFTSVEIVNAGINSAEEKSIRPIVQEVTKQVAGWGGAYIGMWAGGKVGIATGSVIGTPGIGTIIGGLIGSIGGGILGYYGISNILENEKDED